MLHEFPSHGDAQREFMQRFSIGIRLLPPPAIRPGATIGGIVGGIPMPSAIPPMPLLFICVHLRDLRAVSVSEGARTLGMLASFKLEGRL